MAAIMDVALVAVLFIVLKGRSCPVPFRSVIHITYYAGLCATSRLRPFIYARPATMQK